MKTIYIQDLEKNQVIVGETFAVYELKRAEDKNGKPYGDLLIGDKTGKIKAKIWSDVITKIPKGLLKEGKVASFSGKIDEYRGNLQMNVQEVEPVDEDKLDDFIKSSEYEADDMYDELLERIEAIEHDGIKNVLKSIVQDEDVARKLKYWPAARSIHHDFRSGLLQHILEMLEIADSMKRFYPDANYDILTAGIILHDIGKIEELDASGLSIDYTKRGALIGHIAIGAEILERFGGKELPEDVYIHIKHLILSHHGKVEYGSPIVPATTEALMLTNIDNLSSKSRTAINFVDQIQGDGEFTNFINWLEGARLWDTSRAEYGYEGDEDDDDSEDVEEDQLSLV